MPRSKCPSITSLRLFNNGQLSPSDIELIALHLEVCPSCLVRLEGLDPGSLEQGMKLAMADEKDLDHQEIDQNARKVLDSVQPEDTPTIEGVHGRDFYELGPYIREAGLGPMFQARDLVMDREETVIIPNPKLISSLDHRAQFIYDANNSGSLVHTNIVNTNQFGWWDEKHCYITMPKNDWCSLDRILKSKQSFELTAILAVFGQVCQALRTAHRFNVVHRHLSPKTIFVSEHLGVRVSEFGLVIDGRYQFELIQPLLDPTPFHSPEAIANQPERIDVRTDVFSLGVVLKRMLAKVDSESENLERLAFVAKTCCRASRRNRFQTIDQVMEAINESIVVGS